MSSQGYVGLNIISNPPQPYINSAINPYQPDKVYAGIFNMSYDDHYKTRKFPYIFDYKSAFTTSTSIVVDTPNCDIGDLLIAFSYCKRGATYTSPSGWVVDVSGDRPFLDGTINIWSKVVTEIEPSNYTFSQDEIGEPWRILVVCIKNSKTHFNSSIQKTESDPITIPDDSSDKKLILIFILNDLSSRNWIFPEIENFPIYYNETGISFMLSAVYRTSSNTSLSYDVDQSGNNNSFCVSVIVK